MKKLLIFIFSFVLWQTTQAQTNVDSLLCKTWKIDFPQTYALMSATAKQSFDNLPEVQRVQIQQALQAQKFTFQATGVLVLTLDEAGGTVTGTWQWVVAGSKFMMQVEGENTTKVIVSLTQNSLIIDTEGTPAQTGLFDKIYLSLVP